MEGHVVGLAHERLREAVVDLPPLRVPPLEVPPWRCQVSITGSVSGSLGPANVVRMSPTGKPGPRTRRAAWTLALLVLAASAALASSPIAGEPVADLSLPTLGGSQRVLSKRTGPTVLVFFRGVW